MTSALLIRNGQVTDPFTGRDEVCDILCEGGVITAVGKGFPAPAGARVFDASGLLVTPGLIDTHVHFRDPGFPEKETIATGAAAAKRGGFTTVICMANTKPPVDCEEVLARNLAEGKKTGIHVCQAVTVTRGMKGAELVDMEGLAAAGAAGFTDDGLPIKDPALLYEAMRRAAALGLPVSLHEEDPAFIASPGVNAGRVAEKIGVGGALALAEESMAARDCAIALHTGCELVIQHISSGGTVKILRAAKAMGARVHGEATPHHFTLTEEDVLTYGTNARMNPPLRTAADREEIRRGLADGTLDLIATDHAPHTAEEKARDFAHAPSGITGLETSFSLGWTALVRPGVLTPMQLLTRMTKAPAALYRLPAAGIAPGAPADIAVFAPQETWTAGNWASKASNSPFAGWELYAPTVLTVCGGNIVYER